VRRHQTSSSRSTPNAASLVHRQVDPAAVEVFPTSRRKLVIWNATPRAAAAGSASSRGTRVPRIGSICSPITAAEPCT
jgi:hypothetical protein